MTKLLKCIALLAVSILLMTATFAAADDEFAYLGINNLEDSHAHMMDSIVGDSTAHAKHMDDVIENRKVMNEVFNEAHDATVDKDHRDSKRMLHDVSVGAVRFTARRKHSHVHLRCTADM